MALLPVAEALARLLAHAAPVARTEMVALHDANRRVLAADVAARLTQPPFDNSAMDGYAVRHADIARPGAELSVIGTSAAGHAFSGSVGPGQTVRIFTGAPMPEGADTVLIQEDAEIIGEQRIRTLFAPAKGRHLRPRGQDFHLDQVVLRKGDRLDAGRLTLAAAMNHPDLPVYARPKIAILATGDELLIAGSTPGPSQIIASNTFGVAAIARDNGADVIDLGIAGDDPDAIRVAVEKAREDRADVLVTLGGASVGDHDLVRSTLLSIGMQLDFWKIAMRPGKPLMVGTLEGMTVLGLPGNPVSSLVCAFLFLEPLTRHLASLPARDRHARVTLATALPENDKRQDYVRARLLRGGDGELLADAFGRQDSSMMQVFAASDCLIIREPHAPAAAAGSPCRVVVLRS
ncbi:molybdopterin molybdotransferase MoeA [Pararhizobium sp.]|uniref:molybdopterin molybdotransferase MoeA n=1 Tax=Pararhizobium sp. TaxID=1977563 RepID=UPI00271FCF45|nr:gephyrin-like molybdotransferase Glp [Pararhizobium sp.]MDO9415429.1 molybdopterin molybdotransferase MoeA [Pararhizobium sp.]